MHIKTKTMYMYTLYNNSIYISTITAGLFDNTAATPPTSSLLPLPLPLCNSIFLSYEKHEKKKHYLPLLLPQSQQRSYGNFFFSATCCQKKTEYKSFIFISMNWIKNIFFFVFLAVRLFGSILSKLYMKRHNDWGTHQPQNNANVMYSLWCMNMNSDICSHFLLDSFMRTATTYGYFRDSIHSARMWLIYWWIQTHFVRSMFTLHHETIFMDWNFNMNGKSLRMVKKIATWTHCYFTANSKIGRIFVQIKIEFLTFSRHKNAKVLMIKL